MKPIRGDRKREILYEPWGLDARPFSNEDVDHLISDAGSLESHTLTKQVAFDCGCADGARGGFCVACIDEGARGLICSAHFSHCQQGGCGAPVCLRHRSVVSIDGREIRLCIPCYNAAKRKEVKRGLLHLALRPFMRSDGR